MRRELFFFRLYPRRLADVITKAVLSSQLFKDPECWSGWDLNPQPSAQQSGALPTELTGRRRSWPVSCKTTSNLAEFFSLYWMRVWIQFVISVLLWELFHIKNVLDSFFSIRLLLKRVRSFNPLNQEPITWSEQLPCTRVTVLSRTSLFLERFWREFRISFKSHKPVSKTYRPKNNIFCLLVTLGFHFWYLMLRMRL